MLWISQHWHLQRNDRAANCWVDVMRTWSLLRFLREVQKPRSIPRLWSQNWVWRFWSKTHIVTWCKSVWGDNGTLRNRDLDQGAGRKCCGADQTATCYFVFPRTALLWRQRRTWIEPIVKDGSKLGLGHHLQCPYFFYPYSAYLLGLEILQKQTGQKARRAGWAVDRDWGLGRRTKKQASELHVRRKRSEGRIAQQHL